MTTRAHKTASHLPWWIVFSEQMKISNYRTGPANRQPHFFCITHWYVCMAAGKNSQCIGYTMHYTVNYTLQAVHYKLCTVHYNLHCILCTTHHTLHTAHCTLYIKTLHYTLCTIHYNIHFTLYVVHYTPYTTHCALHTVHYTLYTTLCK
jgi:hypothetical protein